MRVRHVGGLVLVVALWVSCGPAPPKPAPPNPRIDQVGNFRGSTMSAAAKDGAVVVMFQPALPGDDSTVLAAVEDALSFYFDAKTTGEWRPIGDMMRVHTSGGPFDVTPIKEPQGKGFRLNGLVIVTAPGD